MKLPTFSTVTRRALICGVIATLFLGLYGGIWYSLRFVRADLSEKNIQLESVRRASQNQNDMRLFVSRIAHERGLLTGALVEGRDVVPLFELLEKTAHEGALAFTIHSVGEPAPIKKAVRKKEIGEKTEKKDEQKKPDIETLFLPLSFEANGSFEETFRFLRRLEVFPFALVFSSVRLAHEDETRTTSPYEVSVIRRGAGREAPRGPWTLTVEALVPLRASPPADL